MDRRPVPWNWQRLFQRNKHNKCQPTYRPLCVSSLILEGSKQRGQLLTAVPTPRFTSMIMKTADQTGALGSLASAAVYTTNAIPAPGNRWIKCKWVISQTGHRDILQWWYGTFHITMVIWNFLWYVFLKFGSKSNRYHRTTRTKV